MIHDHLHCHIRDEVAVVEEGDDVVAVEEV
jgi:hypothetical protein